MAKKGSHGPPEIPASIPRGRAADLLRRQIQRGRALLEQRPLPTEAELTAWQSATREYLEQAFGSGNKNVFDVVAAGFIDGELVGDPVYDSRQEHALRREALQKQLTLLAGCVQQLEDLHGLPEPPAAAPPDREYDVAQICANGHVVNYATRRTPVHNAPYCRVCGAATTTMCEREHFKTPIRGLYWGPDSRGTYETPRFCDGCGWPYPWTSAALKAAREMAAELEGLTAEERETLARSLDDLVKDSPQTTLAATRFKKLVAKATTDGAAAAFKQLLVRAVTEAAKQLLWPGSPPIAGV